MQSWFSFLLQHGAIPYQTFLFDNAITWLLLVNSQSGLKAVAKSWFPIYHKEVEVWKHYFTDSGEIFSDKLSKFVIKCNEKSKWAVLDRLSRIYSHIFIDEVQDLAGYDLALLRLFFESNSVILLVWDPRQVTYLTHHESKFSQYKNGGIKDFISKECDEGLCSIDEETLNNSYRNNDIICRFSSKLYPSFVPTLSNHQIITGHDGIFLIKPMDIPSYMKLFNPMQLRWNKDTMINKDYPAMNFGNSKGLWFDRVLIYPTLGFIEYLKNGCLTKIVKGVEKDSFDIARLYVALTRAKFSVGIVCEYDDDASYIDEVIKFSPN